MSALRPGKGSKSRASGASPDQPLELWGYESAPPVRLVREVLCELEIPYKSVTAARGSRKAVELKETEGKFQVGHYCMSIDCFIPLLQPLGWVENSLV